MTDVCSIQVILLGQDESPTGPKLSSWLTDMRPAQLVALGQAMKAKLGLRTGIKFHSYAWVNGVEVADGRQAGS